MSLENLSQYAGTWVSQYLAGFCLLTIIIWALISFMRTQKWERPVRDAGIFFLVIGTLTLVLALRPPTGDAVFWYPITWFCFAMLLVMELLWVALLCETIYQAIIAVPARLAAPPDHPHYPTNSSIR